MWLVQRPPPVRPRRRHSASSRRMSRLCASSAPQPNFDDGRASFRPGAARAPALTGFTAPAPARYPAMTPAPPARPVANRRLRDELGCITMLHYGAIKNRFRRFGACVPAPRLRLAGSARLRRGSPYCWREARLALMGGSRCGEGVRPPGTNLFRAAAPQRRGPASEPHPTVSTSLAVRPGPVPRVSLRVQFAWARFAHRDPAA